MTLATRVLYEFDRFVLDPAEQSLLCGGHPISLTPKAFDILCILIQNKGRLLDKNELIKKVWPNSFVEEANLSVNISALRKALGDSPDGQRFIGTVPKRGYRFVMSVREVHGRPQTDTDLVEALAGNGMTEGLLSPEAAAISQPTTKGATVSRSFRARWLLAGLLLAVAGGLLGYGVFRERGGHQSPALLRRLAILPFQNLKPDPNSDFLGFSLADAIITKLGYVSALNVRPSSSVQKYRDQAIDPQKVATELNVDTLLTGTFIREGDELRITSQLIDVRTQNILWRDTFDLKYDKLRTVQDSVAQQIINGLKLHLSPSEAERMRPDAPIDPLGYEYYLRGVDLYSRGEFLMAIEMLEESTEIDPNYALTWAQLGRAYNASASFQFGGRDHYHKAQVAFEKALALQPVKIEVRIYMANLLTDTGRVEQAVSLLRDALKANPNQAEVHWELGYAYRFAGMLEESVEQCERARALDPEVKLNTSAFNAYLYLGQYDRFLDSLPKGSDVAFIVFYRGFGNYYKNEREEAARNFDHAYELDPSLLQAQIGKAISFGIHGQAAKGIAQLLDTEQKMDELGVGDPEAEYKIAQGYAVLGDQTSALRVFKRSVENGFFPYPYLAADPMLDSIRKEAVFAGPMQAARRRHESFRKSFF